MTAKYNIQLQDSLFDGSYEILAPVGRGRNSVVYKARNIQDPEGRSFALKVLVAGLKDPSIVCSQAQREAAAMRACEDKNISRLFDYVATPELCYLVMDYAAGGDLGRYLAIHREPLPVRLVLPVMDQVLCGLNAIHAAGYIHRDIKPENILITGQGAAKISDFGIAVEKARLEEVTDAHRGVGTFEYLAPESLSDGTCDEHTDMYAAAVTFYQLLSAVVPFSGDSFSQQVNFKLNADLVPLSYLVPGVSKSLSAVILKALKPRRSDRFESIDAFRSALLESVQKPASRATHKLEVLEGTDTCDELPATETPQGAVLAEAIEESEDPELAEVTLLDDAGYRVLAHSSADDLPTLKSHTRGIAIPPKQSSRGRFLRNTSIVLVLLVSVGIFSILSSSWSLDSAKALVGSLMSKSSSVIGAGQTPELEKTGALISAPETSPDTASVEHRASGNSGFAALGLGSQQGSIEAYLGAEKAYTIFTYAVIEKETLVIEIAGPGSPTTRVPFADLKSRNSLILRGDRVEIELKLHPRSDSTPGVVFGTFREKSTGASGSWSIKTIEN